MRGRIESERDTPQMILSDTKRQRDRDDGGREARGGDQLERQLEAVRGKVGGQSGWADGGRREGEEGEGEERSSGDVGCAGTIEAEACVRKREAQGRHVELWVCCGVLLRTDCDAAAAAAAAAANVERTSQRAVVCFHRRECCPIARLAVCAESANCLCISFSGHCPAACPVCRFP